MIRLGLLQLHTNLDEWSGSFS